MVEDVDESTLNEPLKSYCRRSIEIEWFFVKTKF